MHCFEREDSVFLANVDWKSSTWFRGSGLDVDYLPVESAPKTSVLSSACQAATSHLEFLFTVPPNCPLDVRLLFSDPESVSRPIGLYANGEKLGRDYDVGQSPDGGETLQFTVTSESTGLLDVALQPASAGIKPLINGIQVYTNGACFGSGTNVQSTTDEASVEADTAVLVYRMACSLMDASVQNIPSDLTSGSSKFMEDIEAFSTQVTDVKAATTLFSELCVPAVDADHMTFNLDLDAEMTYSISIYFSRAKAKTWSDIVVVVNGKEVFTTDRTKFAPGAGSDPSYLIKKFETRTGSPGLNVTVTSLSGFPPVSGLEVYRTVTKQAATSKSLLDKLDNRLVVDCGSTTYTQSPLGEVLYPDTEAFTAAGLLRGKVANGVAAGKPADQDLIDAGAFKTNCYKEMGVIESNYNAVPGESYTLTFYWAENAGGAMAGSRLMDVDVDGANIGKGIDVFASAGAGKTFNYPKTIVAKTDRINVKISASVGVPMLSAIAIDGPQIDAAAADRHKVEASTGLSLAAACGAAGPDWRPLDTLLAAGFVKYTAPDEVKNVDPDQEGLYATHCYFPDGGTLTMLVPVVPNQQIRVVMHFAEVYYTEPGKRQFDVMVNKVPQFQKVDVAAEAGTLVPLQKEFVYVPKGPFMTIQLVGLVENPFINGIEIYSRDAPTEQVEPTLPPAPPAISTAVPATATVPAAAKAAAPPPAPAAAPAVANATVAKGGTEEVAVQFTVPKGATACVPQGALMTIKSLVNVNPSQVGFGDVDPNDIQANFQPLALTNPAADPVPLTHISCEPLETADPAGLPFFVFQFGESGTAPRVACGAAGVKVPVTPSFNLPGGNSQRSIISLFEPASIMEAAATVSFLSNATVLGQVTLSGTGGDPFAKAHTLHPVVTGDTIFFEPKATGGAEIFIDGSTSHTHDTVKKLKAFAWQDVTSGHVAGKDTTIKCFYPFGTYTMSLTITDTGNEQLSTTRNVIVAPDTNVPGTLVHYYKKATSVAALPALPDYAAISAKHFVAEAATMPAGAFVLRMLGKVYFSGKATTLKPIMNGAAAANVALSISIDGVAATALTVTPTAGQHVIDVRIPMTEAVAVSLEMDGQAVTGSIADVSTHPPIINGLTTDATVLSGQAGVIKGFLIQAPATVTVGGLPANISSHQRDTIEFDYPTLEAGPHDIVVTRNGMKSNAMAVTVQANAVEGAGSLGGPWDTKPAFGQKKIPHENPSRIIFCHGKAYVSNAYGGGITEYTFDSAYEVLGSRLVVEVPKPHAVADKAQWSILGLACDPRDNDANFKLYFTHSELYGQQGEKPALPAPYYGGVYYIQPNVQGAKLVKVMDQLSVANGDHVVNGLDFLNDGRLIVAIGSQTNAGVPGALGYLPENPTAGVILVADVNAAGFQGAATYAFLPSTPADVLKQDPMDQRFGEWVEQTNPNIKFFAVGTRNPYGLKVGLKGNVICTINGPNLKFGQTMTGLGADGLPILDVDPETSDVMYLDLKEGCYAGSPNPARCRAGAKRECTYIAMDKLTNNPPEVCKPDVIMPSSIGGPMEYTSYAFGGLYHGRIFVPSYKKHMIRYDPDEKKQVTDKEDSSYPGSPSLDVSLGPGGVHLVAAMEASQLLVNYPIDATVAAHGKPSIYDVSPNKGLVTQTGPNTFTIGGANFDTISTPVTVTFGGVAATAVKVAGPAWITGSIPSNPTGTCGVDVSVTFGATTLTLPESFCYLAK